MKAKTTNDIIVDDVKNAIMYYQESYCTIEDVKTKIDELIIHTADCVAGHCHDLLTDYDESLNIVDNINNIQKDIKDYYLSHSKKDNKYDKIVDLLDAYENQALSDLEYDLDSYATSNDLEEITLIVEETLDDLGTFEDLSQIASDILDYNINDREMIEKFLTKLAYANNINEAI